MISGTIQISKDDSDLWDISIDVNRNDSPSGAEHHAQAFGESPEDAFSLCIDWLMKNTDLEF